VRTRILLSLAVSTICAVPLFAQTTQTAPAPPVQPTPAPAPAGSTPTIPAYGAASTNGQSSRAGGNNQAAPAETPAVPVPQQGPAPSTTPGPPTQQEPVKAYVPYGVPEEDKQPPPPIGSVYIPVDSWIYPEMTRLYSLGYVDTMFLSMRPWTRLSVLHMLLDSQGDILADNHPEAVNILDAVLKELEPETNREAAPKTMVYGLQSAYTRMMGIGGPILRDSYHLGQTINNDYGRPYETGFNNITGASGLWEYKRFSLYLRGEYQHAPSGSGYSLAQATYLSNLDAIPYGPPNYPQDTIPSDPIASQNNFRLVEGTLSFHWWGHEISGGKSDAWLGPAQGSAMEWSNNAENIYSFRINRVEPVMVPLLSKLLGPLRYDFFYGSLKGHTAPNDPWTHSEMFAFRPTNNFEFGFQRTIIFGGKGHSPVTLHAFLEGFFSTEDSGPAQKYSRDDPGARFTSFNSSYRIPKMRQYLTWYVDAMAHDDVTPISAPRRASYRTGLYLSQIPKLNRVDFRVEAVSTDPNTSRSNSGSFNYFETIQRQGYTNKGYIMGDWIGREAKGGQVWLTYNLSGNEWVQLSYLNKKTPKDFIPDGTTQNDFRVSVVKRIVPNVELNAWVQYERWKAPFYKPGLQTNTVGAFSVTWYPKLMAHPKPQ
jgi:Capsule assembly protein Wzi